MVRLTDRPNMTLDVYCGHKTTTQQKHNNNVAVICNVITLYCISVCYGGAVEKKVALFGSGNLDCAAQGPVVQN